MSEHDDETLDRNARLREYLTKQSKDRDGKLARRLQEQAEARRKAREAAGTFNVPRAGGST